MTNLDEWLFFNGINGNSGSYGMPPMEGVGELRDFLVETEEKPHNFTDLRDRNFRLENDSFVIKEGLDPTDLAQAGWGIIFPAVDFDPRIEEALAELIAWRRGQTGEERFHIFKDEDGLRPNESKQAFLSRHGHSPVGPVDPEIFPYYVLLVGDPAQISYRFQYELDVQCNVGRLYFDDIESYANYARSVVDAEKGKVRLPRKMTFFGPSNEDDRATQLSAEALLKPLADQLSESEEDWQSESIVGEGASRARLEQLLGGDETPALLFTASHGMEFDRGDPRQVPHQGALLCQDWPGPRRWHTQGGGPIPERFYMAGDHVASDASVWGTVAFFFACYGAGTPLLDDFARQAWKERMPIAEHPFVARLPQRLLGHPRGGALAVIGHVERAWGFSFKWPDVKPSGQSPHRQQVETFNSALRRALSGQPLGEAMNYFDDRYANVAIMLNSLLDEAEWTSVDPYEIVSMWTANNDARGYALLGDPAVRLPVVAAASDEEVAGRDVIEPVDVSGLVGAAEREPEGSEAAVEEGAPAKPAPPAGSPVVRSPAGAESFGLFDDSKEQIRTSLERATKKLVETVSETVEDLTTLEVHTYTAANLSAVQPGRLADAPEARLRALTRIRIDGDLENLVPVRETESLTSDEPQSTPEIDDALWQIHRDMVEVAQRNKIEFLKAVSDIAGSLLNALR